LGTSFGRNVLASIVANVVKKAGCCLLRLFIPLALIAGLLFAFGLL
jgi:hypothetical protein